MRLLGLDQSSNSTGFCIIEDGNIIKHGIFDIHDINKKDYGETYYQEKIHNVNMFLERLIKEYEIELVIIEDVQKQANVKTFKQLAWLQGSLIQTLYNNKIKYAILSPSQWGSILGIKTGKREVVKKNTIKYIKDTFNIDVVKDDDSDAIAICYAGWKRYSKNKLEYFEKKDY